MCLALVSGVPWNGYTKEQLVWTGLPNFSLHSVRRKEHIWMERLLVAHWSTQAVVDSVETKDAQDPGHRN